MEEIDNAIENLKFATIQKNVMERHYADKLVKYISDLESQNKQLLETVESLKKAIKEIDNQKKYSLRQRN